MLSPHPGPTAPPSYQRGTCDWYAAKSPKRQVLLVAASRTLSFTTRDRFYELANMLKLQQSTFNNQRNMVQNMLSAMSTPD